MPQPRRYPSLGSVGCDITVFSRPVSSLALLISHLAPSCDPSPCWHSVHVNSLVAEAENFLFPLLTLRQGPRTVTITCLKWGPALISFGRYAIRFIRLSLCLLTCSRHRPARDPDARNFQVRCDYTLLRPGIPVPKNSSPHHPLWSRNEASSACC